MSVASPPNIYEMLQGRLTRGEFKPGQRLRSEQLRHDYNVSASTIREVLLRLSTVGLVDFIEQRGFRVPEQSAALRDDLTRTRIMLECEGACLSIQHGGMAWEARLTAAHHELKHIETRVRSLEGSEDQLSLWAAAELKFHRTLIEECGSAILIEFHHQIYQRFRQQMITVDKEFAYVPENVEQHQRILNAVLEHDEALVRELIRDHLSRSLQRPFPEPARESQ